MRLNHSELDDLDLYLIKKKKSLITNNNKQKKKKPWKSEHNALNPKRNKTKIRLISVPTGPKAKIKKELQMLSSNVIILIYH